MKVFILVLSFFAYDAIAQIEDAKWVFGIANKYMAPDPDTSFNGIEFNFIESPIKISRQDKQTMIFYSTCSSIVGLDSTVLFYTNGCSISDGNHRSIEDTINFGPQWINWGGEGLPTIQAALTLPFPDHDNEYYLLYTEYNLAGQHDKLKYSFLKKLVDKVTVINKDVLIGQDLLSGQITACKHANGRDWWIVCPEWQDSVFNFYLLDDKGIKFVNKQILPNGFRRYIGQINFSPDASKLVLNSGGYFWANGTRVSIYDFDRCSGIISNPRYDFMNGETFSTGVSFSDDSRYVYTSDNYQINQYDLLSADIIHSKKIVANYDGFFYVSPIDVNIPPYEWKTLPGYMILAPDGKIYITSGSGGTRHMGVIEYPNEEGELSDVRQHSIFLPAWAARTAPNFPNYRLGPLDGSNCDTLGLDNNPIAKYRYEGDTLDHLKVRFTDLSYFRPETWHWDFGDGTSFDGKKPYWHTFPKNGVYHVCLTVSNENSSNTLCRNVVIGTTSIADEDLPILNDRVSVFPNPTDGEVLLTLSDYIPEHGVLKVYDLLGKMVMSTRVYYGWNNIDMTMLPSGNYIYEAVDKDVRIGEGKIVKM